MYETLEHWKQYKLEKEAKELQEKINKEFQLKEAINELDKLIEELMTKELSKKEFDKQLNKIK